MAQQEKTTVRDRRGFYVHAAVYAVVNALLVGINFATSSEHLWFKWPLLGWGIGLLAHGVVAFALPRRRAVRGRLIAREMTKNAAEPS